MAASYQMRPYFEMSFFMIRMCLANCKCNYFHFHVKSEKIINVISFRN